MIGIKLVQPSLDLRRVAGISVTPENAVAVLVGGMFVLDLVGGGIIPNNFSVRRYFKQPPPQTFTDQSIAIVKTLAAGNKPTHERPPRGADISPAEKRGDSDGSRQLRMLSRMRDDAPPNAKVEHPGVVRIRGRTRSQDATTVVVTAKKLVRGPDKTPAERKGDAAGTSQRPDTA